MAEKTTIARPYAKAVFALARSQGKLKEWSGMLGYAAAVAAHPDMRAVIANPGVGNERLAGLFIEVCGERLNEQGKNLIHTLVENDRLALLPEITVLYEELRAEEERTIEAECVSAYEISAEQQQKLVGALRARLQREVTLTCSVDGSLIGGVVIKAGDLVIDGSVKAQINKLAVSLSS
ncbi:MAG: F0F1 ATP synthase subunit delta [Gammaproteobacteria bacterium RBG_16_57_12]|nr:MAG: F0F1 ATP synthase subunit delta [Gammaproteobacteria bacterium RBG_16_57_12]